MLNILREKNKKLIKYYTINNDAKELTKQKIIEQILKHDNCFQELSLDEAYSILKDLQIDNWKEVYAELLSI